MSRGESRVGTLALLKRWTQAVRRHEQIIRARWWTDPIGKLRSFGRARLDERLRQEICELGRRYQGILYEILASGGVPKAERGGSQIKIWQAVEAEVRIDPEPWRVPGRLWSACVLFGCPRYSLPERLRCKLMLRAFIEEIPESEERTELLRLAYQHQGEAFEGLAADEEALGRLSRAYPLLHEQLLRNARHLADWSGGAFSAEGIAAMTFPFEEFEEWLFETSSTPGGEHVI